MNEEQTCELTNAVPETASVGPSFRPRTDIVETDAAYHVTLDVPGVAEGDVDVTLDGDTLSIEARATEPTFEGRVLRRRGYRVGPFRRSFRLGEGLARGEIDAELSHGVLTVTVPKTPERQPRKISVRTA